MEDPDDREIREIEKGKASGESDEVVEVKGTLDKVVPVRLPSDKWKELRREASELGVGPTALARMWVMEKLRQGSALDGEIGVAKENQPTADVTLNSILDAMGDLATLGYSYVRLVLGTDDLTPGSPAATERARLSARPAGLELFNYIRIRASQSLVAAGDAIRGLSILLRQRSLLSPSGGVARDIIESAALCAWLTDVTCDPNGRLSRMGGLLLKETDEMRKLFSTDSATESEEAKAASERKARVHKWLKAECIAPSSINYTTLAKDMFDAEFEYRYWSNLLHGNPDALRPTWRMHADARQTGDAVGLLITVSVDAYMRAVISYVRFFRPDLTAALGAQLNDLCDRLGVRQLATGLL